MTRTPLDEFLEAAFGPGARLVAVEITPDILTDRAALVKHLWNSAVIDAPPGALEGDQDGIILTQDDPASNGRIEYHKITYGDKAVIEAEGIVVCQLIG